MPIVYPTKKALRIVICTEKTKLEGKLSLNTTCTCKDENEDYFRSYEYFDMTMTRATGKFKMSQ